MRCTEINPNLGAFVLGGLEPEEEVEVYQHLASCSRCRGELRELDGVIRALEAASPPAEPPSYLKEEILSRVRAGERAEKAPSSTEELSYFGKEPHSTRGSRLKNLRFILPGVAAAAIVAVVALGIFFGSREEPPVATVQLIPLEENDPYWGVAELHPKPSGNQQVELKLNNLEEPGSDSFYEAWFTSGEKYISAGTFTTAGSGETDVWLNAPPETRSYPTLLITEQTATGDPAPSQEEILRGKVL
jgi:Anti-sigma-K factor rskA/Putative zinc-finger